MIGYEIEFEGLEEQIALFEGYETLAGRELGIAMQKSVLSIQDAVVHFAPIYQGILRGSIGSKVTEISTLSLVGRVGTSLVDELYPQVMEFGREAGKLVPPYEPMKAWVEKVIHPRSTDLRRITNAIRFSIARKGIKGREYLKKGWEASQDKVKGFFAQALENIANGLSNKKS